MMHPRKAIRDAATQVLTGLPSTGARVFPSRVYEYDPAAGGGPGLMIYTFSEESQFDTVGQRRSLMRTLDLAIEIIAALNDRFDDALDQVALEVERTLGNNPTLNGTCKDIELRRTQVAAAKSAEQIGGMVMTFAVTYRTLGTNPETAT